MTGRIIVCGPDDDHPCTCGAGWSTPGGMHHDDCMVNPIARIAARAAEPAPAPPAEAPGACRGGNQDCAVEWLASSTNGPTGGQCGLCGWRFGTWADPDA
jgi:hypothetical protein